MAFSNKVLIFLVVAAQADGLVCPDCLLADIQVTTACLGCHFHNFAFKIFILLFFFLDKIQFTFFAVILPNKCLIMMIFSFLSVKLKAAQMIIIPIVNHVTSAISVQ